MRLTNHFGIGEAGMPTQAVRTNAGLALSAILAGCLVVFALDYFYDAAPVQHLYYLPIILAARYFGLLGGLTAGVAAAVLYHVANHILLFHPYLESDILQIVLFLAVGVVSAVLVRDAKRLRALAMTDDLTGLHNLRSFEAKLLEFVRGSRRAESELSLLVLDVDHLKRLNDLHGHLVGAEAVRAVGRIIAATVPADAVACRYGGDEFAVVLPDCSETRAEEIAAILCRSVNASAPWLKDREWPAGTLSISVGVASSAFRNHIQGNDAEKGEALFQAADNALYQAKDNGRNRVYTGAVHRAGSASSN